MKKFTYAVGIMLVSAFFASAQTATDNNNNDNSPHFSGGFYAGVNGSQIDGDAYEGYYHGGLDLAITAQYPVSPHFFLSMDIGFSQKGAQDKFNENYGNLYKITINYADVPILIHYYDRKRFGLYLGMQYSHILGDYHEMINNTLFTNSFYQGVTSVNTNDYEFVTGMTFYITTKLSFDIRFCYSVASAGYSPESLYHYGAIYNNLFQFRLGYIFGMPFDKDRSVKWLHVKDDSMFQ